MRGPPAPSFRAGAKLPASNEAHGVTYSLPAPYGGWNANGNLSNMPPLDAVVMDNVYPGVVVVSVRKGSTDHVTGFATTPKTFMVYEGPSVRKMFASTETGVYDVSTVGALGSAAFSCTSSAWTSSNFSNAAGNFLVAVNGMDKLRVFNGTTWQAIDGSSTPAITGIATTALRQVTLFKRRLWFIEQGTMNLWYLPTDSFAGAATIFPVGELFTRGGKVLAMGDWTVDSGQGSDDYFTILSSRGELAVYKGTDPSSSTTWSLVGVYYVGTPVGTQPLVKFGGDLLVLTITGVFPLSSFVQSTIIDRSKSVSDKVRGAFLDYMTAFGTVAGWQVLDFPEGNSLFVNVPISTTQSVQFVMNKTTKAWCRFLNWNATSFCVFGGNLYFAGGTKITQAWTGASDSGVAITGTVQQAYTPLGRNGQKQVTGVRPHISVQGSGAVNYGIDADFVSSPTGSTLSYLAANNSAIWDLTNWDQCIWTEGVLPIRPSWLTVPCDLGYLHSFRLQITSSTSSVVWTATNFLYNPAGVL